MAKRVPAEEIYKITGADLSKAIQRWNSGEIPPTFKDSTKFDLLVGSTRIPPKMVVALAAERPLGRVLVRTDLSGGESSPAFRLLLREGYDIVSKINSVEGLDAGFSVGRNVDNDFLIVESRGPDRNVDYLPGLEALLFGLADIDATLDEVLIETRATGGLEFAERRISATGIEFPVALRRVGDIGDFRRSVTKAVASTGRAPGARGPGNPTKRLRLSFSAPDDFPIDFLAKALSGAGPGKPSGSEFSFTPSAPGASTEPSRKRAQGEAVVTHTHADIQARLYDDLVSEYGNENVAAENLMAVGNPADIVVQTDTGFAIYEIKTSLLPRQCIRQAMGQLLEYGYWAGSPKITELVVVGPSEADGTIEAYLGIMRSQFGLPLRYLCVKEPQLEKEA